MQFQRFTSFAPRADLARLEAAFRPLDESVREGSWYDIQNAAGGLDAEVFIYGPIGEYGVSAADFVREFSAIRAQRISIRVNSPGGNVMDGFAIFNAIARHPADTTSFVDGSAGSAASYIILGAKHVKAAKRSTIMIHRASAFVGGNRNDMEQMLSVLDKYDTEIASVYADKAGGTVDEWLERMDAETWLTAQEAYDLGLVDEIDGVEAQDRVPALVTNTAPPERTPEPVSVPEPIERKVDWHSVLEEIADEAFYGQFATKEVTS